MCGWGNATHSLVPSIIQTSQDLTYQITNIWRPGPRVPLVLGPSVYDPFSILRTSNFWLIISPKERYQGCTT